MGEKSLKRARQKSEMETEDVDIEVPTTRGSEDEPLAKKGKWTNKTRVLVLCARGIGHRGRHLLQDLQNMMPHSKTESKMQKKESLFAANEMAEMKNCEKCLLFEGRKGKDVYMWAANVARGPSVKFEVENIHTMAELKMTGNCLRASRPLLSFDNSFTKDAHLKLIKELFVQIFGVPNKHPKSQPFYDHVYTFSVADGKIWFRNFQILDESGSLSEIGPRMVLNPIKVFDGSFCGQTLWENTRYITPNSKRAMLKKLKSHKYQDRVAAQAAHQAGKPTGPTFHTDETDVVFATVEDPDAKPAVPYQPVNKHKKKKNKNKKRSISAAVASG
eukprot:TRINITY_DN17700_c0_g1_i1.p1 TRINITY_DN17700_c0_g1~~TRINITY_DN17700_c0_g1_i1.p1  ORF type:complete len:331 (+),score=49.69 TRINITY_DN17700_c0_g1_i1:38-1030(+)